MENPKFYAFVLLFFLVLIFFNCLMSRDIYNWTPSIKKQIGLHFLVWLVPVGGIFLANKLGNIGWLRKTPEGGGDSIVGGAFMEADSVVNPGARHKIEMVEKQKSEIHYEHMQAGDENSCNDEPK